MKPWHGLLDAQIAGRPSSPALRDSCGADWTYSALGAAVDELQAVLSDAGVRPGDRVMILVENCAAAVAALFACSRIGACALPVNARLTASEIDRIADHSRPAVVLLTSAASGDATAHAERLETRPLHGRFGRLHLATPYKSAPDPDLSDVAAMLFTTGTTGPPKGVMLTHGNLVFAGRASARLRGMTAEDVIYGVLPISHVFGLASVVTASILTGARIRLEPRFSAARTLEALSQGITLFSAVPQMHALLMQHAREKGLDHLPGGTLRYTSSGAAPLDPDWKRRAEAFYGIALQNGYGMTESTAGICATSNPIGDPDISVGLPLPGVEIRLDPAAGGTGDGVGEVLTRGPHVMKGYYRNHAATEAVLQEGWLRTGDLGRLDARGNLHIVGRCKELIIHGGFNVYPPEVEAALNAHPQVVQCAVVGRRVSGDEEVVAFVQVADGDAPTAEELRAFAAERLAGYKRPSRIVVTRSLPAAPTGKILKHRLLDVFAGRLD